MRIRRPGANDHKLEGIEFKEDDVLEQRYLILGVRRGFMGVVYLARDIHTNDVVALKTFQRKFTWVPEAIESFTREAEIWMRVGWHPNIVQAKRLLRIAGRPHIVMEYFDGRSLRDLAKILSVREIFDVMIQICWAMHYAFQRCGIVHRDLKPDNVLISPQQRAKVTDFGLARAVSWARPIHDDAAVRSAARDIFRGAQPYMSPEQRVPDGVVGPWSDIYSAGVMLFELLTGRVPFTAPTVAGLTRLHLEAPAPDLRELMPSLPAGIEHIVGRCLQKHPARRYNTFAELERDLQMLRSQHFGGRLALPPSVVTVSEAMYADSRGLAHLSLGEHQTAQRYFRAAVEAEPHCVDFWSHLAAAEIGLMHYEEALFCTQRGEQFAASDLQRAELWRLRGEAHEKLFHLDEALDAYKQIVVCDRRYHQGWAGLGRLLSRLGRHREAYAAYREACALNPSDPALLVARGDIERLLGQRKQALRSYEQALQLDPRSTTAWCGKGACLLELKRYHEAEACYTTARRVAPESLEARRGLLECQRLKDQAARDR